MRKLIFILAITFCYLAPASAQTEYVLHDELEVNGHAGYLSACAVHGELDKVILVVPGFDTSNDTLPIDELTDDFEYLVAELGAMGWDIVYFEYVDGSINLKHNAENLAQFIRYLDTQAQPNYHLAALGGSMGGIVVRTLLVQENSNMGIETFVSLDSPHWGVTLSNWVNTDLVALALDYKAARQMANGHPAYERHYGWLREVEKTPAFKDQVLSPLNTCAITLSDGNQGYWAVKADDEVFHNRFYPVSSFVEYSGLRSTYMPYHSTAYLINDNTKRKFKNGKNHYRYKKSKSRYFDTIIANPRAEHEAPDYAVLQAANYIVEHGPE
jgi:hypothetical protein